MLPCGVGAELFTGEQPFVASNLPSIIYNITERPHTPLRELRADALPVLGHILDRCLKKDLAGRYRSCLDLAADLSLVFDQMQLTQEQISGREKFDGIKDLGFFSEFPEPEIWEIINASSWQEFAPEEEIIQEGDADMSFYIIGDGDVNVRKADKHLDVPLT